MTLLAGLLFAATAAVAAGAVAWCAHARRGRLPRREMELLLHQLKNPIQSILLHADLLDQPTPAGAGEEARAELRDAILREAERAAAMLSDFSNRPDPRDLPLSDGAGRRGSAGPRP